MVKKLKNLGKRLDWFERAKRDEERPLLSTYYDNFKKEDEAYYKEQMQTFFELHKETYLKDLEEKKRLSKMTSEKNKFADSILKRRQAEYEELKKSKR